MIRFLLCTVAAAAILAGCAAPSIQPVYAPGALDADAGFVGEWATDGPTVTRATITEGEHDKYLASLTVHHEGRFKAALGLEAVLTRIGEHKYLDLFLAGPDRERLAGDYGFLAMPVHQVMRFERDGNILKVSTFEAGWIGSAGSEGGFLCETLPIGDGQVPVITAGTTSLRAFLEKHADDPGAFAAPIVFRRIGAAPSSSSG